MTTIRTKGQYEQSKHRVIIPSVQERSPRPMPEGIPAFVVPRVFPMAEQMIAGAPLDQLGSDDVGGENEAP